MASRGLFRGWGPDDLETNGIKFGLLEMANLSTTVAEIVSDDRAKAKAERVLTSTPRPISALA